MALIFERVSALYDEQLTTKDELIAELRRRAEAVEAAARAEVAAAREEAARLRAARDTLQAALHERRSAAAKPEDGAAGGGAPIDTIAATLATHDADAPMSLWTMVRRWWRNLDGGGGSGGRG